MASITTTSLSTKARRDPRSRGFTLSEVLVSFGLASIILAGVLSSVLMINRSGYLLNNYIEMEKQARNALETFAIDTRMTESVAWIRKTDGTLTGITLIPPDGKSITYTYDSTEANSGKLIRKDETTAKQTTLVSGIQSLSFTAYKYTESTDGYVAINPALTSDTLLKNDTKMVQISLSALRTRSTLADATNNVVSARYVLRNKPF
jgi:Tfp pilus assembly protein PilV